MSRRKKAGKPTDSPRREPSSVVSSVPPASRPIWLGWLGAAALCGAVICGYLPALHGGFVFDDVALLTENPMIRASDGLYRFWFTTEAYDYWPLTSTTFWLEWRLWGADPTGYHITNLVLHALESLLLWAILLRVRIRGAYLAALIFAVHPVNVESVAWIAQRKNLVGMLFFLLATLLYLKSDTGEREAPRRPGRPGARGWYWLSLAAFLLALLGKGSVAILPAVLLLLAWWQRREVTPRDLVRIVPFALVATVMVVVNIWFQTHGEAPIRTVSAGERLLGAGAVVWFYLSKALLPIHLSFVYPQWHIGVGNPLWWLPLLAALGVSAVLFRFREGRGRPCFMAWAFFCVALLPVMGLTDVYFMKYSLVADHYQHIALIGVTTLMAAGWSAWRRESREPFRTAAVVTAAVVVGALVALTARQSANYADENTLYRATIETNPDAWLAHYNLAVNLNAEGRHEEELAHLKEAVRARPDYADAHSQMAIALLDAGRPDEALFHAEQAVRIDPDMPEGLVHLGITLGRAGRSQQALEPLERAVRLRPDSVEAHHNLGLTLAALGRLPEAIDQYQEALRIEPDSPETYNALGSAWIAAGRCGEAVSALERALELSADSPEARAGLARALTCAGRSPEAIAALEEVLRLEPDGPHAAEAHYNLGVLMTSAGRTPEGVAHYARALQLRPRFAEAHYNLAVVLLAEGRGGEAIFHLEEAVRSNPNLLAARVTLGDVYARTGRLPEAIAQARAAMPTASPAARAELEERIRDWQSRAP